MARGGGHEVTRDPVMITEEIYDEARLVTTTSSLVPRHLFAGTASLGQHFLDLILPQHFVHEGFELGPERIAHRDDADDPAVFHHG
jgi:hypothetical protein